MSLTLMMEVASTSVTMVSFYQIALRNNPEDRQSSSNTKQFLWLVSSLCLRGVTARFIDSWFL
jgi:hypothetical protein